MDRKTDRTRIRSGTRTRKLKPAKSIHSLLLVLVFLGSAAACFAQPPEPRSPPRTDLLTLNGGKPTLSATGEGITAYKTTYIYKLGTTRVRLLKPADVKFKFELPAGYTIFNDLIYQIETDIVFSGPHDIVFHVPSARTKETFDHLRILYPEHDYADPEVPKWRDATLDDAYDSQRYLSDADYKERLRDFKSRTLHAFTEHSSLFFVVALRDPAKSRDNFTADLKLTGTVIPQVTEGRTVTYELKITNKGPDTATGVALHAQPGFEFVSVEAAHGKCRMWAQNVHCKFASLEKDRSLDVKIVERCEWDRHYPPYGSEKLNAEVYKHIQVVANEPDAEYENNSVNLMTEVLKDPNKGPVIEVLSPSRPSQLFTGPAASVPVRFKASDPDGFIKKVELFDLRNGKSLGEPTLRSEGEYELILKDVPFGAQYVGIVATDNLDRVTSVTAPEIIVSSPAITNVRWYDGKYLQPFEPGKRLKVNELILVTSPMHENQMYAAGIRKIEIFIDGKLVCTDHEPQSRGIKTDCVWRPAPGRYKLQAVATDEDGVAGKSEVIEVVIERP